MDEGKRINKYLADMGYSSRREADRLIAEGKVSVNDYPAIRGMRIREGDTVKVEGKALSSTKDIRPILMAFNKPRGIVCTSSHSDRATNIIEYIGFNERIFPIGRLDKESEGLILLTNRGELVNSVNRMTYGHEKEYIVKCRRKLTPSFLRKLSEGVDINIPIIDAPMSLQKKSHGREYVTMHTAPASVQGIDEYTFDIILTQGLNRQIRRMCDSLSNRVESLKRIRVMNISLGNLGTGKYRIIRDRELSDFETLINRAIERS